MVLFATLDRLPTISSVVLRFPKGIPKSIVDMYIKIAQPVLFTLSDSNHVQNMSYVQVNLSIFSFRDNTSILAMGRFSFHTCKRLRLGGEVKNYVFSHFHWKGKSLFNQFLSKLTFSKQFFNVHAQKSLLGKSR